jgi:peptidoglycan/xylan/chitin deacetylase (PgdA/CDA1 family)
MDDPPYPGPESNPHGASHTLSLKDGLAKAIRYSGLPWLIRNFFVRNKAAILLYHDPTPETFERHLAFLSRLYVFISLDQVVDALHDGDWSGIPERALVITFDDGHARNRELLEIARRYDLAPTIYLCSQISGTARNFWFHAAPEKDVAKLKQVPDSQRLRTLADRHGFDPTAEMNDAETQALSQRDIATMKETFHFGSHTRFHRILTACNETTCQDEVALSRDEVEALVGLPCKHFAYPNGDYRERELELVKAAGYRSARTIDVGWTDLNSDPFRLKITGVTDNASIDLLVAQLSGISTWLTVASKGSWNGRAVVADIPADPDETSR